MAIVFFVPIIFDFSVSTYNMVDLYKVVFFRLVLSLALLAYLAKIFLREKISYRGGLIFSLTGLLALSFFSSSFFSLNQGQSFWGSFLRHQGFYNFFNYLLFFALLVLNLKEFRQVKRLLAATLISTGLVCFYGLIQFGGLDPIRWAIKDFGTLRIFSTLGQPNFFGHFLIMVLPLNLYFLLLVAKNFWAKFFTGLIIAAELVCLLFTYSRAAWLGFIGLAVTLLFFWLYFRGRKKIAYGLVGVMVVGCIAILAVNLISPVNQKVDGLSLTGRIKSLVDLRGGSGKMRLFYLQSALKEIKSESGLRLFLGYGPDNLAEVLAKYYQPEWGVFEAVNTTPDRVHNWFFDQLLAVGILGLLSIIVFYCYFIYKAIKFLFKRNKLEPEDWLLVFCLASLVGYFINNFFSFSLFTVSVYLYFILALAWFIINRSTKEREANINLTPFSRIAIWAVVLNVVLIFVYTNNFNQVLAEKNYVKALKASRQKDCGVLEQRLNQTLKFNPNSLYYQENFLYLSLNCLASAGDDKANKKLVEDALWLIEQTADRQTYGLLVNQARVYGLLGQNYDRAYYQLAEKTYNRLIIDYPYMTTAYEDLALLKLKQGNNQAAINILKQALGVLPALNHPYLNDEHREQIRVIVLRLTESLAKAYFEEKNYDLAIVYFKKSLELDPLKATLYKNLADVYFVKGELDQAIKLNQRGFQLNQADYHWPLQLSLLYREKKDLTPARLFLGQALKLAPDSVELKKYEQELNKK